MHSKFFEMDGYTDILSSCDISQDKRELYISGYNKMNKQAHCGLHTYHFYKI